MYKQELLGGGFVMNGLMGTAKRQTALKLLYKGILM